jgi:hypothetical protein
MQFLHPGILWALPLVAIPIIVHLFNFRKHKTVYFSAVFFLKEIKEETEKKNKIKHWIVLLTRIFALICIILAFAQPTIPGTQSQPGKKVVSIYIDNSFSMESQKNGISLLETAKGKALDLIMAYGESDRFQIVSNEFSGAQQHIVTKDQAIELIQKIQPSPISRGLHEVFERQKDLLQTSDAPYKKSYFISDFQCSTMQFEQWQADSTIETRWIPVQDEQISNVYVDSVWFDIPHHALQQAETLHVKVKSINPESQSNVRCELNIAGQNKGVTNLTIEPNAEITIDFVLTPTRPGIQNGKIILDDQPIVFDNEFYFSYSVDDVSKIGITYEGTSFSNRLFRNDPNFQVISYPIQQLSFDQYINQSSLIAENINNPSDGWINAVYEAVKKGATLILIPNALDMGGNWNQLFQKFELGQLGAQQTGNFQATHLDFMHPLYASVFEQKVNFDLPHASARYGISNNPACQPLITYQDGIPFLLTRKIGEGQVYYFNTGLGDDQNNLLAHSIFPTSLLRMAETAGSSQPLYHFINQPEPLVLKLAGLEGNEALTLKMGNTSIIPLYRNINERLEIELSSGLQVAGNYDISWGSQQIGSIGINYNAAESDTRTYTIDDLKQMVIPKINQPIAIIDSSIEQVGAEAISLDNGQQFWWYLVILAILFLFTETLLIALWKM